MLCRSPPMVAANGVDAEVEWVYISMFTQPAHWIFFPYIHVNVYAFAAMFRSEDPFLF